jgi:chemotaxis protein MotA
MNLATIIGLANGLAIVVVVMILDGGSPAELFAHPSALILTIGGALMASTITSSLKTVTGLPAFFLKALKPPQVDAVGAIEQIVKMTDRARREGLLALEEDSKKIEDAFMRRGVMMVVDGIDPAQVRGILSIDVEHMRERHAEGIKFFNSAGGFAPTMGIIGTVMGLITVLKNLADPSSLGKSIAGAFLATLWGILTANLIWLPLAGKLQKNSEEEVAYREMIIEGLLALQAGENPRVLREKLYGFLPPKLRQGEDKRPASAPAAASAPAEAEA